MLKNNKGLTGTDIVISIVAIIIFSSIILALLANVKVENLKVKSKLIANIYLIEILENIGIATYEEVSEDNINNLIPKYNDAFNAKLEISSIYKDDDKENREDIIKEVTAKVTYKLGNKTYEEVAKRIKVKE